MKRITKPQVLLLHEQLLQEFGGTAGIRVEGLLDSALSAPLSDVWRAKSVPFPAGQSSTIGVWPCLQPSFHGRQQTDRRPYHVGFSCPERNGTVLQHSRNSVISSMRWQPVRQVLPIFYSGLFITRIETGSLHCRLLFSCRSLLCATARSHPLLAPIGRLNTGSASPVGCKDSTGPYFTCAASSSRRYFFR